MVKKPISGRGVAGQQPQRNRSIQPVRVDAPPRIMPDGSIKQKAGAIPKDLQGGAPRPETAPGSVRKTAFEVMNEVPMPRGFENARVTTEPVRPRGNNAAALQAKLAEAATAKQAPPKAEQPQVQEIVLRPRSAPPAPTQPSRSAANAPQPARPSVQAPASAIMVRELACPPGYTRQLLPSNGVPYSPEVFVRPLDMPDLLALIPGLNKVEKGDMAGLTTVYDALNNCIIQDIRVLTEQDLRFLMYWWKINSFPRSPYTVTWTSRYGNKNSTVVTDVGRLTIKRLTGLTPAEYNGFLAKGVRMPTLRDTEAVQVLPKLSPVDEFLALRAQYVHLTAEDEATYVNHDTGEPLGWFESRMEKLRQPGGIDLLTDISEFAQKIEHGVIESVEDSDRFFDPEKAVEHLRFMADSFVSVVNDKADVYDASVLLNFSAKADEYEQEAKDIEAKLRAVKDGVDGATAPEPRKEVVQMSLTLADFFPAL